MSTTTAQRTLVYSVRTPSSVNNIMNIQLRLDTDAQTFELTNRDGFFIQGRTEQTAPNMISLIGRLDGALPMYDLPLFRLITIGDTVGFDKGTIEDLDMTMGGVSFNSHTDGPDCRYSHILMRCYMHDLTAAAEAMSNFPVVVHLL